MFLEIEEIEEVGSSLEPKSKKTRTEVSVEQLAGMSPQEFDGDMADSIYIEDLIEMDFDGPMCKMCHL